jgi:hypothetical protein
LASPSSNTYLARYTTCSPRLPTSTVMSASTCITIRNKPKPKTASRNNSIPDNKKPAKRWNPIFRTNRKVCDRLFVEAFKGIFEDLAPLDVFLSDWESSGQPWEVEQTRKYLCKATSLPNGQIWVDRRITTFESNTKFSEWLDSSNLSLRLKQHVSFLHGYMFLLSNLIDRKMMCVLRVVLLDK